MSLMDYYAESGTHPGRWFGKGLESLGKGHPELAAQLAVAGQGTEAQMFNLFGLGMHPNREAIHQELLDRAHTQRQFRRATNGSMEIAKLGGQFRTYTNVWLSTQPFVVHDHSFPDPLLTRKHMEVCTGTANLYKWAKEFAVKTAFGTDLLMEPEKEPNQITMFARLSEFMEPIDALRMATRPPMPSCSGSAARAIRTARRRWVWCRKERGLIS